MCFAVFPQSYSITTFVPRFSPDLPTLSRILLTLHWDGSDFNSENSLIHPVKLQQTAFSTGLAEMKPGRNCCNRHDDCKLGRPDFKKNRLPEMKRVLGVSLANGFLQWQFACCAHWERGSRILELIYRGCARTNRSQANVFICSLNFVINK